MRENLSMKGIVSIMLFLFFVKSLSDITVFGYTTSAAFIFPLFFIMPPIIDYTLKAYNEQFEYKTREVNIVSKILNVVNLGIPFLMYGYISLFMMILNDNLVKLKKEWFGIIILGVLTLGIVPAILFLLIGPFMLIFAFVNKSGTYIERNKLLFFTSLIGSIIASFGIIIPVIALLTISFKLTHSIVEKDSLLALDPGDYLLAIIISAVTMGYFIVFYVIFYYLFELVMLDLKTSRYNEDKHKIDDFYTAIHDIKEQSTGGLQ